jgi:hypothetical protein
MISNEKHGGETDHRDREGIENWNLALLERCRWGFVFNLFDPFRVLYEQGIGGERDEDASG